MDGWKWTVSFVFAKINTWRKTCRRSCWLCQVQISQMSIYSMDRLDRPFTEKPHNNKKYDGAWKQKIKNQTNNAVVDAGWQRGQCRSASICPYLVIIATAKQSKNVAIDNFNQPRRNKEHNRSVAVCRWPCTTSSVVIFFQFRWLFLFFIIVDCCWLFVLCKAR